MKIVEKYLKNRINEAVSNTELLQQYFSNAIRPVWRNLKIGGWELDIEEHSGTLVWQKDDSELQVYATPFWEDTEGVNIEVYDADGGYKSLGTKFLAITGNAKKDVAEYLKIMKSVLSKIK